jgi:hypothetical protein
MRSDENFFESPLARVGREGTAQPTIHILLATKDFLNLSSYIIAPTTIPSRTFCIFSVTAWACGPDYASFYSVAKRNPMITMNSKKQPTGRLVNLYLNDVFLSIFLAQNYQKILFELGHRVKFLQSGTVF